MANRQFRFFCDGIKVGETLADVNIVDFDGTFTIGNKFPTSDPYYLHGLLDEFRFSVGTSRWIDTYVPPAEEYSMDPYTKILLHMNGSFMGTTFIDEAGHIFTATGDCHTDTFNLKFGSAAGYFSVADSTSFILNTPDSPDFIISGNSSFAVDFWAMLIGYPGSFTNGSLFICGKSDLADPENNRWGVQLFDFDGMHYLGIQYLLGGGLLLHEFAEVGAFSLYPNWHHFAVTVGAAPTELYSGFICSDSLILAISKVASDGVAGSESRISDIGLSNTEVVITSAPLILRSITKVFLAGVSISSAIRFAAMKWSLRLRKALTWSKELIGDDLFTKSPDATTSWSKASTGDDLFTKLPDATTSWSKRPPLTQQDPPEE